jgi:hypothetical protein
MLVFEPDWNLDCGGVQLQFIPNLLKDFPWVCSSSVALIDEAETRNIVPTHLSIDSDRLRLDSTDRTEHQNRTVKNTQRTLDLNGKVDVSRSIDNVNLAILPFASK